MKEITITTQKEFDELPDKFPEFTRIYIRGNVTVRKAWGNSSVVAWGNSSVVARENSSVEAWGNSSVVAWGNSSVEARENSSVMAWGNSSVVAWGNSSVEARENSSVKAWENSSVEAWGNSSVVAWGNSSVVAWGNSSVMAWGNSSVVAWGNSSVEARENSSVKAWENSSVEFFSNTAKGIAKHNAIFIVSGCDPKISSQDDAQVMRRKGEWLHDIKSFCDCYKSQIKGKYITLYKSVNPKTKTDFYTGKIHYRGTVSCPDFDPHPDRQCGGGLHLSPTPKLALSYNQGLLLECKVALADIVIYPQDITKVRCKKVKVIGEYKQGVGK